MRYRVVPAPDGIFISILTCLQFTFVFIEYQSSQFFSLLYVGGTYARLVYNWYRNIFHAFAVLIVFHAANEKTGRKQDKKREQNKGRKIETLLSSPIHLAHHCSTVEPVSLSCHTDIATLSLCCRSAVALLSHRYRSAVARPLLVRCRAAVTQLMHRYCSTVAPLMSLLLLIRSHTAIAPVSLHCRSAAVAPTVATQSHRYRTVVAPLSNRDRSGPERV